MLKTLMGKRVLVIEDDYLQASDLTLALELQGSDVVGPFPDLEGGLKALTSNVVEAAVLDIRLGDERVYEVADSLTGSKVPFMFVTGFDRNEIPDRFREVRCLQKPVDLKKMTVALAITVKEHARTH